MNRDLNSHLEKADSKIITFAKRWSVRVSQLSLAGIFLWFGILKLIGVSAIDDIVIQLVTSVAPSIQVNGFIIALGVLEILIALTILEKDLLRLSLLFLILHLVVVSLPLLLLPELTWQGPLIPTLEGQYLIKNILIAVVAMGILADLENLENNFLPTR